MIQVFETMLLLLLVKTAIAENISRNQTPALVLAKQTGATLYEEEHYEAHNDCNDTNHQVKKRSSDEDVDYEVYQGVVGRPGIDFPIYPRIPKTSFSCRSYGNGYFADMETDCQVFHICEDGRKISFLCPNGTIFQQSELTCDWWFKVNCLGSQGYYAESVEILNKQRVQRIRPAVPVQGFSIVGGATSSGLDIKPRIKIAPSSPPSQRSHQTDGSNQHLDSSEIPSMESVDFEDTSSERQINEQQSNRIISNNDQNNNNNNNNNNDNESQITAETASFVANRRRNSLNEKTDTQEKEKKYENDDEKTRGKEGEAGRRASQRHGYSSNLSSSRHENGDRSRNSQRGKQRYRERDEKKTSIDSYENIETKEQTKKKKKQSPTPSEISKKFNNQLDAVGADAEVPPEYYHGPRVHNSLRTISSSTIGYNVATYSTARRLESTRTTPFYTPTIPSLIKSKAGEGKSFYIKSDSAVTTPSSTNRFTAGLGLNKVIRSDTRSSTVAPFKVLDDYNPNVRPLIPNTHHNIEEASLDTYRDTSARVANYFNADSSQQKSKLIESSTTFPPITGPTYLPKGISRSKSVSKSAASADDLLLAPSPIDDVAIRRNVDEMLRTMNLLKSSMGPNKVRDVESVKSQGQARAGLEIPPSSGPDALISLAKYFANEPSVTTAHALNAIDGSEKPRRAEVLLSAANTASISNTALRSISNATIPFASVSIKSDDIAASLLSEKTVNQYSNLFGLHETAVETRSANPDDSLLKSNASTMEMIEDTKLGLVKNSFPQIGSTDATIRNLADKPESRKIAQVFSNALNTYLENPVLFREQLASVRPTEPPSATSGAMLRGNGAIFLQSSSVATPHTPTKIPLAVEVRNSVSTTSGPRSIAVEINNRFDYSTQASNELGSTTDSYDSSTLLPVAKKQSQIELSAELMPPNSESGEGEEFLQREQSQSFIKSRNELQTENDRLQKKYKTHTNAAFVEEAKTTPSPWDHISENDFLDPLTINDGLMKEQHVTTISPFTYLPNEMTTMRSSSERIESLQSDNTDLKNHQSSAHRAQYRQTVESTESWSDIFNTYDLPIETLPSSSGLQRIANKLFGGLNETEALHLKNVMQQAEHNRQVLSLLLLLIQTCDDQNGKALERSRKHLLNALIDMDGKLEYEVISNTHQPISRSVGEDSTATSGSNSSSSSNETHITPTTTGRIPVTTYRRNTEEFTTSTLAYLPTTTDQPTTTPTTTTTIGPTTAMPASVEETTKFEIRVEDVEDDLAKASSVPTSHTSDQRALELLKSLYSLASKFTSRR